MVDNIQPLLDRIHAEGVKKVEEECARLLDHARAEAADLLEKAREEIRAERKQMEAELDRQAQRQQAAMEQAARDLVLQTRSELNRLLQLAAESAAGASLSSAEQVSSLLATVLQTQGASPLTLEAGAGLQQELQGLLPALLSELGKGDGVELQVNPAVETGFRLRFPDGAGALDVTADAVAEWIASYLRPELAALFQSSGK